MGKQSVPKGAAKAGTAPRVELAGAGVAAPRGVVEPRLLSISSAAFYCGMTIANFERHCPIRWRMFGKKRLWDRRALDSWIDIEFGAALPVAGGGSYDEAGADDAIDRFNAAASNKKPRRQRQAGAQKAR